MNRNERHKGQARYRRELPAGFESKEKRDRFAQQRCREVEAYKQALGGLPERWKRNEQLYENDPAQVLVNVTEETQAIPMPLWTQRADRIVAAVFGGITSLQPYVQCIADDYDRVEDADCVEADLQFLVVKSSYDLALYQALRIAVNTNLAHIRVAFDPRAALFTFEEAHPLNVIAYPHEFTRTQELKTIGHRFERMLMDVRERIRRGDYLDARLTPGDADRAEKAGRDDIWDRTARTSAQDPEDERLELYELLTRTRVDDELKIYRCVVAFGSQELLDVEEWPYSKFNYQDYRYSKKHNGYLPSGSPAQNAQGPQMAYTRLINTILQGGEHAAFPPLVITGGTLTDTKLTKYSAGTVFEVPATVQAQQLPVTFQAEPLVSMIPLMERVVDGATAVPQIGLGQDYGDQKTATEIRSIMQGQAQGEAMYTNFVARLIEEQYEVLFELYQRHFASFKERWGSALRCDSAERLDGLSLRFEVSARSGANDPSALVQKLQMLLQLSARPGSHLDAQKVEEQIVQALQLPFSSRKLFRQVDFGSLVQEALSVGQINPSQLSPVGGVASGGDLSPGSGTAVDGAASQRPAL